MLYKYYVFQNVFVDFYFKILRKFQIYIKSKTIKEQTFCSILILFQAMYFYCFKWGVMQQKGND